jgi:hypothetical protein
LHSWIHLPSGDFVGALFLSRVLIANRFHDVMTTPPRINRTSALPWMAAAVLGLAGVMGLAVLFFFNPSTNGFYPVCLFHQWTGLNCPGCGGTRSAYALLHGRLVTAFHDNALFLFCLAFGAGRASWMGIRKLRNQPAVPWWSPWMLWGLLGLTLGFAVVRNLPGFGWLSP